MFYKEKYLALSPHVYDRIFEKKKGKNKKGEEEGPRLSSVYRLNYRLFLSGEQIYKWDTKGEISQRSLMI